MSRLFNTAVAVVASRTSVLGAANYLRRILGDDPPFVPSATRFFTGLSYARAAVAL